jgi:uncharacterized protein YprB with RNaseH-like and TPR domain
LARLADPGSRIPNQESADAAEVLGGEWRENRGQRFLVVDRKYSPGHRHGRVAVADHLPPAEGPWPTLSLLAGACCSGRMLFIDLETTGIAGGAGTYAFLVGCAWFQGAVFRTQQFFLANFAAERVLLEAVAEAADACGTVVSYNGKSFDLPLIETRFVLHRMETPFAGMPHVDMLHPARRLWREDDEGPVEEHGGQALMGRRTGGCRLSTIEETLCGHTREWDVPGFEIPSRYFHYVRTADARRIEAVMEHNRLDLLSLALITARASQLLVDGAAAARTAREALGLGRLYGRAGLNADACAAFSRAAEMPGADATTRAEALREYAVLARRERRYEEAAAAWRRILDIRHCPSQILRDAVDGLAVHHEHRLRDPMAARGFALQSMTLLQTAARQQAVQHRLARLNRKLGMTAPAAASLF